MFSWFGKLFKYEDQTEESLEKKGFDPTLVEDHDHSEKDAIETQSYYELTPEELEEVIRTYKFPENQGEPRHPLGQPKGGTKCGDPSHVRKLRGVGKEIIKQIGKKIISGDFNLTKLSFPLTAMIPQTSLENATLGSSMMPYYGRLASETKTPLERMKMTMTAVISSYYAMNMFLKPINPILGETLESRYPDGTSVYCEQISHHPPVTYFLVVGAQERFRYYGYYNFEAKAHLNSGVLINHGKRYFQVGQDIINMNFSSETFCNVFIGTLRLQSTKEITFLDKKNGIRAAIEFGKLRNKPSDYFKGKIYEKGISVGQFDGTYLGFINFDADRYWDCRHIKALKTTKQQSPLPSDSNLRQDIIHFKHQQIPQAQVEKDRLENLQRHDAKIRKRTSVNIH